MDCPWWVVKVKLLRLLGATADPVTAVVAAMDVIVATGVIVIVVTDVNVATGETAIVVTGVIAAMGVIVATGVIAATAAVATVVVAMVARAERQFKRGTQFHPLQPRRLPILLRSRSECGPLVYAW